MFTHAGRNSPMHHGVEMGRAEDLFAEFLRELGFAGDPAMVGTPEAVRAFLQDYVPSALPSISLIDIPYDGVVVLRDLPFYSLCAHHLLPFFGTADVAYYAPGRGPGFGAIARTLQHLARRPQLQERLTTELADHLAVQLETTVRVRLRARHLCMEMRGAESTGQVTTTWQATRDHAHMYDEVEKALQ